MPIYHKLVRDRIPDIIIAGGKTCSTRVLNDADYLAALNNKLSEELAEYLEADSEQALDELGDLLEVIRAIVIARGFSWDELEAARALKEKERGGFAGRVWLDEVR